MIRFEIRGIRFELPLLSAMMPLLGIKLGMDGNIYAVLLSLGIHETAHLFAAYLLKVEIASVRILPFGAGLRTENPYSLPTHKLILIAASGPMANLMLLLFTSSAAHWGILRFETAAMLNNANLVLCLFNLLPALPLDGGRILSALLARHIGDKAALRVGIFFGRALALLMLGIMFYGGIRSGKWNISFLFSAIFIIASEKDERKSLMLSKMLRIQDAKHGFDMKEAKIYQIDGAHSVSQALTLLHPKENAWFVLTKNALPYALLDSRSILQYAIAHQNAAIALAEIPAFRLYRDKKHL